MTTRPPLDVLKQILTECPDGLAANLLEVNTGSIGALRQRHGVKNHWQALALGGLRAVGEILRHRWVGGKEDPPAPIALKELDVLVASARATKPAAKTKPAPPEPPKILDPDVVLASLESFLQVKGYAPTLPELTYFGAYDPAKLRNALDHLRAADRVRRDHEDETFHLYQPPDQQVNGSKLTPAELADIHARYGAPSPLTEAQRIRRELRGAHVTDPDLPPPLEETC